MYSSSPIGLSLCSWNANGLLRRNAELRLFIEKHSPERDILLIQETHLRPSHNFNIANYTCHRNDRITDGSRSAGGTLILIKSSLKHYCLPTPPLRALEATNIILTPPKHDPISITSVYIPPSSDENLFTLDIEYFIQTANNCVLFGDFNASHIAWNCNNISNRGRHLYNFANMVNLNIAYPPTPTRFGYNSANTIDIAIIKNFYYPFTINSIDDLSPDHNPPPGQPIGVTVHFTQQPIREQLLSSQPRQKLLKNHHPDKAQKPRLPDPIVQPIVIMPLSRTLKEGERSALACAITLVESQHPVKQASSQILLNLVLKEAKKRYDKLGPKAFSFRIGLTGPPGAGKSTFIESFGKMFTSQGHKVAVLAVDPSSSTTGGSLLGGVTRSTNEAIALCECAGYDIVIVETVGVGQSEFHVSYMVDLFAMIVSPAGRDELQGLKKGIVELVDMVVVNKADGDLIPSARRIQSDYISALKFVRRKFKRKTQYSMWLWIHIEYNLLNAFKKHPDIKTLVSDIEKQVQDGVITPVWMLQKLLASTTQDSFFKEYESFTFDCYGTQCYPNSHFWSILFSMNGLFYLFFDSWNFVGLDLTALFRPRSVVNNIYLLLQNLCISV
ncbi:methylmalonic aciduria type A homolog, mitochondrial [Trichonephila clavipes]|nr:methylmalonic aciduria type A homolog, mitochondrial [Trichonephila clavipes]